MTNAILDVTLERRDRPVRRSAPSRALRQREISGRAPPSSLASSPALHPERVVLVSVAGREFSLPRHALRKGAYDLRLGTGECVSLEDYATGVAEVLVELANCGLLGDLASKLSHV
jgi:hypothetical protein